MKYYVICDNGTAKITTLDNEAQVRNFIEQGINKDRSVEKYTVISGNRLGLATKDIILKEVVITGHKN